MRYLIIFIIFLLPAVLFGQFEEYIQEDPLPKHQPQTGAAFTVLESGSGIGAFYKYPLQNYFHVGATLSGYYLRDSEQFDVYWYGYPITINKQNNVYLIDLMFSLKKRLMADKIDDSLRPYVSLSAGPVYGMNFPEDDQLENQFDYAISGGLSAGVEAVFSTNYIFGIRFQYRFMKFHERLGEEQDHSMFDLRIEIGKEL
ncbi:MAG: hypothetical protein GF313_06885 [Caldithrix sp.]|nr:hypothetical protein [Caldithrix sp.]